MKKTDARIVNSKKFLKEALLSLLLEYPLSKISIKTLCEAAEINRATFYAHYKDVNSLFNEIYREYMSKIFEYIKKFNEKIPNNEKRKFFYEFVKYIDKNSRLFVLVFENSKNVDGDPSHYEQLLMKIDERITNKEETPYTKYITNFYIYSGGAILYTWIKNNKKESIEEIASLLFSITTKGASFYTTNL
jgi:AcrR family transcriptional regulator